MGDEFFDVPLIKKAGFGVTVPLASYEVKGFADYVTTRLSGQGAVREVIDILRYAHGIYPEVLDFDDCKIDFTSLSNINFRNNISSIFFDTKSISRYA